MCASSVTPIFLPHFSQADFISNDIVYSSLGRDSLRDYRTAAGSNKGTFSFMHTGNSIIMRAPKQAIFETAANLELWPKILPHYRYIRYLERAPDRNVVVMAAVRSGIPISWTSEQIIDRENTEVHFNHLKKWTKGMHVVWRFSETADGVRVGVGGAL